MPTSLPEINNKINVGHSEFALDLIDLAASTPINYRYYYPEA